MSCIDQFQIQNPSSNQATELTSSIKALIQAGYIGLNARQIATVARLSLSSYDILLFNSVNGLSAAALDAPNSAYTYLSPGLPDNQWQIEASGWFNASLATLQSLVLSFVSKDMSGTERFANVTPPSEVPELNDMCNNQIIKNIGAYQTLSVLGIAVVAVIGTLIIVISWVVEPIVNGIRKSKDRRRSRAPEANQWLLQSALHLYRLSSQAQGMGGDWSKCDDEVPVTRSDAKFGRLTDTSRN